MKEINLDIISRDKTGKSDSKLLRNTGKIPAVIAQKLSNENTLYILN